MSSENGSPTLRATQVSPTPEAMSPVWEWRSGVLAQRAEDEAAANSEERMERLVQGTLSVTVCLCYCIALILTAMGVITAMVAWIKYSWNHT